MWVGGEGANLLILSTAIRMVVAQLGVLGRSVVE